MSGTRSPVHNALDSWVPVKGDLERSDYWFGQGDWVRGTLYGLSAITDVAGVYGLTRTALKSAAKASTQ